MSIISTNQLSGDLAVGRNLAIGGDLSVQGSAVISHDLKVEGYLEAPNIKGINKGVFLTVEELNAAYPNPEYGWIACVGNQSPFAAYVGKGGQWVATGGYIVIGDGSVQPDPTPGYDVDYPTDPTENLVIGIGNSAPAQGAGNTVVIADSATFINPTDPSESVTVRLGSTEQGSTRESSVIIGQNDNIVVDAGGTLVDGAFGAAGTGYGGITVDDGGISFSGQTTFGEDVTFAVRGSQITVDDGKNPYTIGDIKTQTDNAGNRLNDIEAMIYNSNGIEVSDGTESAKLTGAGGLVSQVNDMAGLIGENNDGDVEVNGTDTTVLTGQNGVGQRLAVIENIITNAGDDSVEILDFSQSNGVNIQGLAQQVADLQNIVVDNGSSIDIGDSTKDLNLNPGSNSINLTGSSATISANVVDIAGAINYNSANSPALTINGLSFDSQTISCPGAQGTVNLEAENITLNALYDDQQGNITGVLTLDSKQIDIGGNSNSTTICATNNVYISSDNAVTINADTGNGGQVHVDAAKIDLEAVDDDNLILNNTPLSGIKISSIDNGLDPNNAGQWEIKVAMADGSEYSGYIDLANLKAALANV